MPRRAAVLAVVVLAGCTTGRMTTVSSTEQAAPRAAPIRVQLEFLAPADVDHAGDDAAVHAAVRAAFASTPFQVVETPPETPPEMPPETPPDSLAGRGSGLPDPRCTPTPGGAGPTDVVVEAAATLTTTNNTECTNWDNQFGKGDAVCVEDRVVQGSVNGRAAIELEIRSARTCELEARIEHVEEVTATTHEAAAAAVLGKLGGSLAGRVRDAFPLAATVITTTGLRGRVQSPAELRFGDGVLLDVRRAETVVGKAFVREAGPEPEIELFRGTQALEVGDRVEESDGNCCARLSLGATVLLLSRDGRRSAVAGPSLSFSMHRPRSSLYGSIALDGLLSGRHAVTRVGLEGGYRFVLAPRRFALGVGLMVAGASSHFSLPDDHPTDPAASAKRSGLTAGAASAVQWTPSDGLVVEVGLRWTAASGFERATLPDDRETTGPEVVPAGPEVRASAGLAF